MTHSFKLSRRIARLRVPVFAALVFTSISCNDREPLAPGGVTSPDPLTTTDTEVLPADETQTASATHSGGIAFGHFAQPTETFGNRFSGALRNESPTRLLRELAGIKARRGRVMMFFASSQKYYVDRAGNFDMGKWKERVNRFRGLNLDPYIKDGTIIGHMLIDEPNDAKNWNGKAVSPNMVEEMAKYSKQLWPNLATVVRTSPDYLNSNHKYLDAAWAQYLYRRGDVRKYIDDAVSDAQRRGLALVVGLNIIHGGKPNGSKMSASEIEDYGSALLTSNYPCAFLSWKYESGYVSSVGKAMDKLRDKAESRPVKSCRSGG
jgi:hypothetical protein